MKDKPLPMRIVYRPKESPIELHRVKGGYAWQQDGETVRFCKHRAEAERIRHEI